MQQDKETHAFMSEARRVLDLMIHSVYSNPDIFLRELISNASDALDKLRIEKLSDPDLEPDDVERRIVVGADRASRTVAVRDNGVGMSREELIDLLGTVARSGTGELAASEAPGAGELIGQFGVGFYSSFIVADRVRVVSRRAGSSDAWAWESDGDGEFTIEPASLDSCGTVVSLHIKDRGEEDERARDYLSDYVLRSLIKQYSDFVSYPIYVLDSDKKEGDDSPDEPVNSMKALWTRPESEVSDEEYNEFYKHVSHDWEDPMERITYRAEGTNEFHALLFIPSRPPMDLYMRDVERGVDLYIKRVFIMSGCRDLVPDYLRFVRGVIDSEDLPLNVSREILQQDPMTAAISRSVTRKILDALRAMKNSRADDYKKFWSIFGAVVKEGLVSDAKNKKNLLKLCLFETTKESGVSIENYASRMADGQKDIYYITGGSVEALRRSPKLEAFERAGVEVLLLGDAVDEFWLADADGYEGHSFKSVSADDVELPGEQKSAPEDSAGLAAKIKDALAGAEGAAGAVDEVRFSARLVDSPATFTQKGAPITPQLRAMMKAMGQEAPADRRTLELNPDHALIKKLEAAASSGEDLKDWARVIVGLAQAADGEPIDGAAEFTKLVADLLAK